MEDEFIILDDEPVNTSLMVVDPETTTQPPFCDYELPILYKKSEAGNELFWLATCYTDGIVKVLYGHVGGTPQEHTFQVKENASGRSLQDQTFLEVRSRFRDKVREGYVTNSSGAIQAPPLAEAMLATPWDKKKAHLVKWPVLADRKIDGIRNRVRVDPLNPDKILMRTRGNKPFVFFNLLSQISRLFLNLLPPGYELDGEMYRYGADYNWIQSICTRTVNPHFGEYLMQFWIFDLNDNKKDSSEVRKQLLRDTFVKYREYMAANWPTIKLEFEKQFNYSRAMEKEESVTKLKKIAKLFYSMKMNAYRSFQSGFITSEDYNSVCQDCDNKYYAECETCNQIDVKYDSLIKGLENGYSQEVDLLVHVDGELCHNADHLTQLTLQYEREGFEGLVFRRMLSSGEKREHTLYRPDRSINMYKYKFFIDEEATVVGATVAQERGIDVIMWALQDIRGNVFPVRPRGSLEGRHLLWLEFQEEYSKFVADGGLPYTTQAQVPREEFARKIVEHFRNYVNGRANLSSVKIIDWTWFRSAGGRYQANLIGKAYKFKYQELSEDGVPRFPVGVCFRKV